MRLSYWHSLSFGLFFSFHLTIMFELILILQLHECVALWPQHTILRLCIQFFYVIVWLYSTNRSLVAFRWHQMQAIKMRQLNECECLNIIKWIECAKPLNRRRFSKIVSYACVLTHKHPTAALLLRINLYNSCHTLRTIYYFNVRNWMNDWCLDGSIQTNFRWLLMVDGCLVRLFLLFLLFSSSLGFLD